jgi:hypothetical protein
MDQETLQGWIADLKEALRKSEEEVRHLEGALREFEELAHLRGWSPVATRPSPAGRQGSAPTPSPRKAGMRLKDAILVALQEAGGREVHAKDLLRRVRELGLDSKADRPETVMDTLAGQLKRDDDAPIEKTAPLTWRWVGERAGAAEGASPDEAQAMPEAPIGPSPLNGWTHSDGVADEQPEGERLQLDHNPQP